VSETPSYFKKPIPLLYEDGAVMIFDKPSGLLVIPTDQKEPNTLDNIVNHQYALNKDFGHLHPCHRLDRETSGVIMFAKGKRYQQTMMEVFRRREISKKYIAFVHGHLKRPVGEMKSYIKDLDEQKFRRHSKPVLAITKYKVLNLRKLFSVVEVEPVTGRTNQIRIHFKDLGHPLVGERKYAFARDYDIKFRRVALHASALGFKSPITQKFINVSTKLPEDMEVFLGSNN
jgi:23S rRNA pseudouridine1911/1915/1917 synthase